MTIHLPPFLSLLGIVAGGVFAGLFVWAFAGVVGFMFADSHDFGSTLIFLAPLLGVVSCIGCWIFLGSFA